VLIKTEVAELVKLHQLCLKKYEDHALRRANIAYHQDAIHDLMPIGQTSMVRQSPGMASGVVSADLEILAMNSSLLLQLLNMHIDELVMRDTLILQHQNRIPTQANVQAFPVASLSSFPGYVSKEQFFITVVCLATGITIVWIDSRITVICIDTVGLNTGIPSGSFCRGRFRPFMDGTLLALAPHEKRGGGSQAASPNLEDRQSAVAETPGATRSWVGSHGSHPRVGEGRHDTTTRHPNPRD
jgi:hypothetical protein